MSFLKVHSSKRVYLSWAPFTQYSDTYARRLNANPYFITCWSSLGIFKYIPRSIYSLYTLVKIRPSIVICMNPPYFCGLAAYLYTCIFNANFCLDSHSAAFDQIEWQRIKVLHKFLVQKALFSSVTNEVWAQEVIRMGGNPLIIADIPGVMPSDVSTILFEKKTVLVSSSFAQDEPMEEVIRAAETLPNIYFLITGNNKKYKGYRFDSPPKNVEFTGYISVSKYWELVSKSHVIMTLTTRDNTMQMAGSEAITAGKPFITSNWPILKRIFSFGTIFVNNSSGDIAIGIKSLFDNYDKYSEEIIALRKIREQKWEAFEAKSEKFFMSTK